VVQDGGRILVSAVFLRCRTRARTEKKVIYYLSFNILKTKKVIQLISYILLKIVFVCIIATHKQEAQSCA
jgi:hypothetical protein